MGAQKSEPEKVRPGGRLRRAALFVLFSLVLLIPKTLALRRQRNVWNGLRLVATVAGALLLGSAKSGGSAWVPLAGVALILLALVARPAAQGKTVDEQARELGALVVANGGRFMGSAAKAVETRLYVTAERIHVLDLKHRPLLEVPLKAITALRAEEAKEGRSGWRLRLEWTGPVAEFHYDGFFAEHLARVAESTLRSQLQQELPVIRT